jgi:hypothetical protein
VGAARTRADVLLSRSLGTLSIALAGWVMARVRTRFMRRWPRYLKAARRKDWKPDAVCRADRSDGVADIQGRGVPASRDKSLSGAGRYLAMAGQPATCWRRLGGNTGVVWFSLMWLGGVG